ncbi:MAG TPA: hypothetical protein VF041_23075 [Gemmatimonadaceae bacterium]
MARIDLPRMPRQPAAPKGPPKARPTNLSEESQRPFPEKPAWFSGPVTEWAVYYDLIEVRHFKLNQDVYYQAHLFAPELYASRDFFRADFVLPYGRGRALGPSGGHYHAIVFDPESVYTHPDPGMDLLRRAILDGQGYLLILMDMEPLLRDPHYVVGKGLEGIDISIRGRGG